MMYYLHEHSRYDNKHQEFYSKTILKQSNTLQFESVYFICQSLLSGGRVRWFAGNTLLITSPTSSSYDGRSTPLSSFETNSFFIHAIACRIPLALQRISRHHLIFVLLCFPLHAQHDASFFICCIMCYETNGESMWKDDKTTEKGSVMRCSCLALMRLRRSYGLTFGEM